MSARITVKVVPGARRDEIAGWLGDRLKVRVSAAPERGRANDAVRHLLASTLGVPASAISVLSGHASPEKVLQVEGLTPEQVRSRLPGSV